MRGRALSWMAMGCVLGGVVLAGCDGDGAPPPEVPEQSPEPVDLGSIQNVHVYGNLYLAGQPSREDLELLRERGVTAVINLRGEEEMDELDFEEREAAEELGMEYHHLPVADPRAMTVEVLDEGLELLREREGEPTVVHCASGGRVAALWLAKRLVDDELGWTAASAEARAMGMPREYEPSVSTYHMQGRYPMQQ